MAIVRPSDVMIFEPRRGVVACAANEVVAQSNSPAFALSVLDVLLSRAVSNSRHKLTRLCSAVDCALDDISLALRRGGASGEAFTRLVPLTRALAALASDVDEVKDALQSLGGDEQALRALGAGAVGPSAEPTPTWEAFAARHAGGLSRRAETEEEKERREMQRAEAEGVAEAKGVLTTYLRQISAVGGELRELRQHIAATREVWELQLDGARNRLHRLELTLNVFVLALSVAVVPASLLGMNLPHGFEEQQARAELWHAASAVLLHVLCAPPARRFDNSVAPAVSDRHLITSAVPAIPPGRVHARVRRLRRRERSGVLPRNHVGSLHGPRRGCGGARRRLGRAGARGGPELARRDRGSAAVERRRGRGDGVSLVCRHGLILFSLPLLTTCMSGVKNVFSGACSREELVSELRRTCPGRFDADDGAELRLLYRRVP